MLRDTHEISFNTIHEDNQEYELSSFGKSLQNRRWLVHGRENSKASMISFLQTEKDRLVAQQSSNMKSSSG